jgi:hypothetical protein
MAIFRRTREGQFIPYKESDLATMGKPESELEEWLVNNTDALFPHSRVFIFARQSHLGRVRIPDLLGLDEQGTIIVIELKRLGHGRDCVAQVLDYVSAVASYDYQQLNSLWTSYRGSAGEPHEELRSAHQKFHGLAVPLEERQFNTSQLAVVVSCGRDEVAEQISGWLENSGVPLYFSSFSVHQSPEDEEEFLIDFSPLELPVRPREAVWENDFWLNSDERHVPGSHKKMIEHGVACTYGPVSYGRKLQPLEQGARVFLYLSGTGIIAEGTVTEPWSGEANKQLVTCDEGPEYSVRVDWSRFAGRPEQAVTAAEIRDMGHNLFVPTCFGLRAGFAKNLAKRLAEKCLS